MIKKENLKIKNRHGDILYTEIRFPENNKGELPLVILCHGFKGFKDWGCFPYLMEKIAAEGNYAVSFNFSYSKNSYFIIFYRFLKKY